MIAIIPAVIAAGVLAWILRPRKNMTGSRKISILVVTLPSLALLAAVVLTQLLYNTGSNNGLSEIANIFFIAGFFLISAAIFVLTGFALVRKWEIVKGIGFGICIAVILIIMEYGLLELLSGV